MKQVELKPEFSGIHKNRERTTNFVFIPVNNLFQNIILEIKLDSFLIDLGRRNCIVQWTKLYVHIFTFNQFHFCTLSLFNYHELKWTLQSKYSGTSI